MVKIYVDFDGVIKDTYQALFCDYDPKLSDTFHVITKDWKDVLDNSPIINKELYCSFESQFRDDKICIYTVDDKGFLDVANHFSLDEICAIRLKRNNINVSNDRMNRDLNQIIPDSCKNIYVIENNKTITECCLEIVSILSHKWPDFYST